MVSERIPVGLRPHAMLGAVLVFVLALAALTGCYGLGDEAVGDAPNTTASPAEEVSNVESPRSDVAKDAAARIDESSIRTSLAYLTGISPAPLSSGPTTIAERGSEDGRRAAARYMKESFEAAGIPARVLEFTLDGRPGFNVEATLQGTEGKKHLWVTAHLDSVYNAGASDDASGLVSILMTARALGQLNPKQTVHFVAYDLEEVGLFGSSRYVGSVVSDILEREGESAIIGDLHTDMIGYDRGGFDAVMGACNRAGPLDDAIMRASKQIDSPVHLSDDCLGRSDHQNFWNAGFPAVVMTDGTRYDDYPWYHQSGDTMDKLNIPYLRSMIQLNTAATALLATSDSESR